MTIDLTKVIRQYKNKWVALTSDNRQVVASGFSLKSVLESARKKRIKDPSVFKVPSTDKLFIG